MNRQRKEIETENRAASGCDRVGFARLAQCYDHGCAAMRLSECSAAATRGRSDGFVEGVLMTLLFGIVAAVGVAFAMEVIGR